VDQQDPQADQDPLAFQGNLDQPDLVAHQDQLVHLDLREEQDHLDHQVLVVLADP
jgi:hypothetical protein